MCDYVFTICSSLSFLSAARAVYSLLLEIAWGNTRHRSITERHFRNSSFILRWSSSHRDNWDEHKQLGETGKGKNRKTATPDVQYL